MVTLHPFLVDFFTGLLGGPSVDHALPIVWSYCTRSASEFTSVYNATSCGVH